MIEMESKYWIKATFDYVGYADYYSGHGHVFEEDLKACMRFGIMVNYTETVKEVIDRILEDLRSGDYLEILDEDLEDGIREMLTDQVIEKALREEPA